MAVPGDKLESKAEFRIRTVHSVHAYMPSLHYELSPGPFEQRPPSSRDRPKPACGVRRHHAAVASLQKWCCLPAFCRGAGSRQSGRPPTTLKLWVHALVNTAGLAI